MRLINYALLFCCTFLFLTSYSQDSGGTGVSDEDLYSMSLEDLMNMEVTSASKKAERLQEIPSSIYVITKEDIQRSSAQNLMQLLRDNVPGYWAAQNTYKNGDAFIRNTTEGSVLVLLDGTPLLDLVSGSLEFESFDIPFDQIERIEVIKGSGGTIYGANSASGVINIFSKKPEDQNELIVSGEYAYPGQAKINLIATPIKTNKFATTVYGKVTTFEGFDQMESIKNESTVIGDTTIYSQFTGDDQSFISINGGANLSYKASDDLTVSSAVNIVSTINDQYAQYYSREKSHFGFSNGMPVPVTVDSIALISNNRNRLTGNIRADYKISDKNTLFARISTNMNSSNSVFGGGFTKNNRIIDIEVQDNIELGFNSISIGGNFRTVHFDIKPFENSSLMFIDAQSNETLTGIFAQDKISLFDKKLNLFLGIKAENYSLMNDKFYFSPMAKATFIPSDKFTLWGGYTQSYTTPGFVQTNIEIDLFRATSDKMFPLFYGATVEGVTQSVYEMTYQSQLATGVDEATAKAIADAYIQSPEGMANINAIATSTTQAALEAQYPGGNINYSAINGPETEPTSFQNFEAGVKFSPSERVIVEANYYYAIIKDGVGASQKQVMQESKTRPGENITAFYYGNYIKGTNQGTETMVKIKPKDNIMLELSHNWYSYNLEFQENDDFDVSGMTYMKDTEERPTLPTHTFRTKVYYDFSESFKLTASAIYATKHFIKGTNVDPSFNEITQRFETFSSGKESDKYVDELTNSKLIINARIDKSILDGKLNLFAYANDLTNLKSSIDGVTQFELVYPQQTGGFLGAGLKYTIE